MLCLWSDDTQVDLWTEKYSTCPKKGIPCLKCGSTFTNESLDMVLVISLVPLPVNSTSEKKGEKKFFGRMISLNILYCLSPFSSYIGKENVTVPVVFSPIRMWDTDLFLLLWSWLPLQVPCYTLLSSTGRPWFLLVERSSPHCLARKE